MFEALLLSLACIAGDPSPDHGDQLLDVIQTTVKPHTWERKGGRGTGYYWRPGRAMIIRQTQDAHEEIQSLLEQLRRN